MTHTDIYKLFELYFPNYAGGNATIWFTNGKNSVRVRQTNGQEFIFTYHSQKNWKLETVESFLSNMKGGKR